MSKLFNSYVHHRPLLLLVLAGLAACSTTTIDKAALETTKIQKMAIVIGSDARGRAAVIGPIFVEEIYAPISSELENKLNGMALEQLQNSLTSKGYKVKHLKTVPIQWDSSANISNSRESYTNLLRQYDIPPKLEAFDAILFVEYMLRPKTWGTDQISALTLESYETMYAKSKIWLYDPRAEKRLFYSNTQRGYDQVLTHVKPAQALDDVLSLKEVPHSN